MQAINLSINQNMGNLNDHLPEEDIHSLKRKPNSSVSSYGDQIKSSKEPESICIEKKEEEKTSVNIFRTLNCSNLSRTIDGESSITNNFDGNKIEGNLKEDAINYFKKLQKEKRTN